MTQHIHLAAEAIRRIAARRIRWDSENSDSRQNENDPGREFPSSCSVIHSVSVWLGTEPIREKFSCGAPTGCSVR